MCIIMIILIAIPCTTCKRQREQMMPLILILYDRLKYNKMTVNSTTKHLMLQKWNEWGFRLPLCTCYRLNCARTTSRGWWHEWDDTALQTQDLKFEPWRCEAEHPSSRPWRFPTILNHYEWAGKKHFVSSNFSNDFLKFIVKVWCLFSIVLGVW